MCLRVGHDILGSPYLTSELVVTSQRPSLPRRSGHDFRGNNHNSRDGHQFREGHSVRGGHISEAVISQRRSYLRGGHITPDAVVGSYCSCSFASDRSRK